MRKFVADTNIFLRFILNDNSKQGEKSRGYLQKAATERIAIFVPQIVIFEIAFALGKVYRFEKGKIIAILKTLVATSYLEVENRNIFLGALELYRKATVDLVDAFLFCQAKEINSGTLSFDKDFKRLGGF